MPFAINTSENFAEEFGEPYQWGDKLEERDDAGRNCASLTLTQK